MTLEFINARTVDAAAEKYMKRGNDPHSTQQLLKTLDCFHDSPRWEAIAQLAERMIVQRVGGGQLAEAAAEDVHQLVMTLISTAFVAGFDAGFGLQLESTVEKVGGLA